MAHPGGDAGFAVYLDFITNAVQSQEDRKTSIEQRGIAVITTSGTLVTLLFAVIGLATKASVTYRIPADTRWWLIGAVGLLVLAALFGLAANVPRKFRNVQSTELGRVIDEYWSEDAWAASARVARTRVAIYDAASKANEGKAAALSLAVTLEACALLPLAVAVVQIAR